jgi:uncharacterized heparinase superfamily protein
LTFLSKVSRYWETLRPLKPVQFYGRVWFKMYRPRVNAHVPIQPLRVPRGRWQRPAARAASMLGPTQFRFLNQIQILSAQDGWNDFEREKLWLYNLHYFDDLNAIDAGDRIEWHRELIARWLKENPPAIGNGWEPYPTSLRIVNWVKWLAAGNSPIQGMLESLAMQADWLAKRLEWHLLGNHLFANAKALMFAGLFFEGPEAAVWLKTGLKIIIRELPEQVLSDGGNFERSPMYHAIFLEDVLDLVNAAMYWPGFALNEQVRVWRETAMRMLWWLECMTHSDGETALFNDAALGVSPGWIELSAYAARLDIGHKSSIRSAQRGDEGDVVTILQPGIDSEERRSMLSLVHFQESGYVRMESDLAIALLDVAPIGPDYLPGHAHADTLSFEMSVHGQRVVVNGGTSRYGLGPERLRERGTAAHSTVQVAGQDSSEVWGGFRVARRAYPFDLQVKNEAGMFEVACSHDGYKRLTGAPIHRRRWVMDTDSLQVNDTVYGGAHSALARYILHPDVTVALVDSNTWQLTLRSGQNLYVVVFAGLGRIELASYAPEFGIVLPTQCLAVELTQSQSCVKWLWA